MPSAFGPRRLHPVPALLCLALAACGGSVEEVSTAAPGAGSAVPTSGTYAWVLKAQGSTNAPRFGLSLVHPQAPTVERVVEPSSAALTDVKLISAATQDVAGLRATSVRPHSLVYIVNGDVRTVPLDANGSLPSSRVQRAGASTACRFQVDAIDYAQPNNSRFIVSTAGADGACDSADDGHAEVTLSATGSPRFVVGTSDAALGMTRDPVTLAPRGWIFPRTVTFWSAGNTGAVAATVSTRNSIEPPFSRAVLNTPRLSLADDGIRLVQLEFRTDASVIVRPLDSGLTAGGNWQGIGFDANSFYVYRNSSSLASGSWRVLRITRSLGEVSVLASGDGFISNVSMGVTRLYFSVLGTQANRLLSVSKLGNSAAVTLESTNTSTLSVVLASASGVHQLFRATNTGTSGAGYAIEFVDETGARLYASSAGGYPLATAEASSFSFDNSESRSRFFFVTGYGVRGFADTALLSYDTSSRSITTLGNLPGSTDFGTSSVFANVSAGSSSFSGGVAARFNSGVVDSAGARLFSFDAAVANSLRLASPPL